MAGAGGKECLKDDVMDETDATNAIARPNAATAATNARSGRVDESGSARRG